MTKTAIVWSCAHAGPEVSGERFTWLSKLIQDIKPDYTVDLGDGADMRSLNTFDTRYPQAVVTQSYEKDIEAWEEMQDRLWGPYKVSKRKRPTRYGFEGNHENRIKKAVQYDPRIEGGKYGVSFKHLRVQDHYDEYYEYENSAPQVVPIDGVNYAHYIASGNFGTAMATKHHGYSLVEKLAASVTVGHTHKFSYFYKGDARPYPCHGLVVGCYKGKDEPWAGQANHEWRRGVVIKRGIENGNYDFEWVGYERLQREYG